MKDRLGLICCLLWMFVLPGLVQGQAITRGTYLQNITPTAASIKWRTDSITNTHVWWGPRPDSLPHHDSLAWRTYDHTLRIAGLAPSTTYYYAAGDSTGPLEGGDSSHRFTTNPPPGSSGPVSIWAIGDFGRNSVPQRWVLDGYLQHARAERPSDLWLWLGDNAYDRGTDAQYQTNVFDIYDSIFAFQPFWPTPGNHDYLSVNQNGMPNLHSGPYYSIVEVPFNGEAGGLPSGGEMFYSFDYANIHFVSLNSELSTWVTLPNSPMAQWLADDLAATHQPWKIVYFHQPPHSKGSHDSDNFWETFMISMRVNFAPIMEQYGVDLVLAGHSHVYERSKLMYGFYDWSYNYNPSFEIDGGSGNLGLGTPYLKSLSGTNPNRGTVYAVVGNGGSYTNWAALNHPIMSYSWGCDSCVGSLFLDVHNDTLTGRYLAYNGVALDEFTILKDLVIGAEPAGEQPLNSFTAWPNPFSQGPLHVGFTLAAPASARLQVTDMQGHVVHMADLGRLSAQAHHYDAGPQLAHLPAGVYMLTLVAGDTRAHTQLVKLAP